MRKVDDLRKEIEKFMKKKRIDEKIIIMECEEIEEGEDWLRGIGGEKESEIEIEKVIEMERRLGIVKKIWRDCVNMRNMREMMEGVEKGEGRLKKREVNREWGKKCKGWGREGIKKDKGIK